MSADNYFQLPNPDDLFCAVWLYQTHHSFMKIQVHKGDFEPLLWIFFDGIGYFDGPMQWQGANFTVMNKKDQLYYHNLLGHTHRKKEDRLLQESKLFSVRTIDNLAKGYSNLLIKILARDGSISREA